MTPEQSDMVRFLTGLPKSMPCHIQDATGEWQVVERFTASRFLLGCRVYSLLETARVLTTKDPV